MAEARKVEGKYVKKMVEVETLEAAHLELSLDKKEAAVLLEFLAHKAHDYQGEVGQAEKDIYQILDDIFNAVDDSKFTVPFMKFPLHEYGVRMTGQVKIQKGRD